MPGKKLKLSNLTWFFLVVLAASLFRLSNLSLIEFKGDEAINLYLAARPLFGHSFPPGGTVSSIGLLNPPFFNYLLFPFVFISRDPKTVTFFIALVNALSLGFFFLFIKRYYRITTALIASLLYSFSPWAIIYSRKIWTQNLLLPFSVFFLFCLHQLITEKKEKYWFPLIACELFIFQLHQATFFFLLLINFFLLLKKVKFSLKHFLLGLGLGLIPLLPYLYYLFQNLNTPEVFLVAKERFTSLYYPIIFFRPLQILSQGNFNFLLGDDVLTFSQQFPIVFQMRKIFYLQYLFIPFGISIFWRKFPPFRLLVYATVALPLIYFLLHFQPFIHYFMVLMPLLFLFLATGLAFLIQQPRPWLRIISLGLFLLFLIVSVAFNSAFFKLLSRQKALKGDFGTALVRTEANIKSQLTPYQHDPHYQEMLLASYLPWSFLEGQMPVARMIFDQQQTQNNLNQLNERLKQIPVDARIQNELFAFYTFTPLTKKGLSHLETLSLENPGYQKIYEAAINVYQNQAKP